MNRIEVIKVIETYSSKAEAIAEALEKAGALNLTYGNEDIGKIVDAFKQYFNVTKVSRYDRYAAARLAKKHGSDEIATLIQVMASAQGQPYCPVINSISQLEDKFVSVAGYINKHKVKEEIKW